MTKVRVTFAEQSGREVSIDDAETGQSLMQVATAHGVEGIIGECGGGCACATCHCYIEPEWQDVVGPPDVLEEMTLDGVAHITRDNSRLGCQVLLTEEMDGLKVEVAPPQ